MSEMIAVRLNKTNSNKFVARITVTRWKSGTTLWFLSVLDLNRLGTALLVAALAVAVLASGCSKRTKGTISGTVTVDGAAPKTGAITFYPSDGKAQTAGAQIRDGHYKAEVAPGMAKVEVRVPKVVGQKKLYDTPNSPVQPITAEVLPAKYNVESELKADIKLGENEQNFDLKTK